MNYSLPEFDKIDESIKYFNTATREDLLAFLSSEDEVLKQIALLKIEDVTSTEEAEQIVYTLTGHASETREYSSFLINRLMKNEDYRKYFTGEKILAKFANAVSDVNPKVCRKIIEIFTYYSDLEKLYPIMIENAQKLIDKLEEKNKNKNYQYNTTSFHLYWHAFALGYTFNKNFADTYTNDLINLLDKLFTFNEYTLREKAAYLAVKIHKIVDNKRLEDMINKYSEDENFFVSEIFTG